MTFEWDASKSASNLHERGFDFPFASQIFEGPTLEREDLRIDYGEPRIVAVGIASGVTLTVVYTDRIDETGQAVRRIISARRSNQRERQAYRIRIRKGRE